MDDEATTVLIDSPDTDSKRPGHRVRSDSVPETSDKPYIINIVNSIIGVAILAISSSFKDTGLLLTLVTLVCGAILTMFSCSIVVRAAKETGTKSYEYLCEHVLGKVGKTVIELCLTGFMMGIMIGYYIALGDLLPPSIFRAFSVSFEQRAAVLVTIGVLLIQPLVMMKDISSLTTASTFSLYGYSIVCSVVIIYAFSTGAVLFDWTHPNVTYWQPSQFFSTLSLFALGYACHPQIFIVYNVFKKPQVLRMERIIGCAIFAVSCLYSVLGVCGYMTFKDATNGNLLTNYPKSSLTEVMRLSFCFSCIISFPLLIFPVRTAVYTLLKPGLAFAWRKLQRFKTGIEYIPLEESSASFDSDGNEHLEPVLNCSKQQSASDTEIPEKIFYTLSVAINVCTLTVAVMVPDIATLLKLVGSTMGATLAFIIPALIGLQFEGEQHCSGYDRGTITGRHKMQARLLLFVGVMVFFITPISMYFE